MQLSAKQLRFFCLDLEITIHTSRKSQKSKSASLGRCSSMRALLHHINLYVTPVRSFVLLWLQTFNLPLKLSTLTDYQICASAEVLLLLCKDYSKRSSLAKCSPYYTVTKVPKLRFSFPPPTHTNTQLTLPASEDSPTEILTQKYMSS